MQWPRAPRRLMSRHRLMETTAAHPEMIPTSRRLEPVAHVPMQHRPQRLCLAPMPVGHVGRPDPSAGPLARQALPWCRRPQLQAVQSPRARRCRPPVHARPVQTPSPGQNTMQRATTTQRTHCTSAVRPRRRRRMMVRRGRGHWKLRWRLTTPADRRCWLHAAPAAAQQRQRQRQRMACRQPPHHPRHSRCWPTRVLTLWTHPRPPGLCLGLHKLQVQRISMEGQRSEKDVTPRCW